MPTDEWQILFNSIRALTPGTHIRLTVNTDGDLFCFRDNQIRREVSYFAEGTWHPTREGATFEEMKPWITRSAPPRESPYPSPSLPSSGGSSSGGSGEAA